MSGEIYAHIELHNGDKERIEAAVKVMEEVAYQYSKTGIVSAQFLVDDLNDGISALKGVLEGLFY